MQREGIRKMDFVRKLVRILPILGIILAVWLMPAKANAAVSQMIMGEDWFVGADDDTGEYVAVINSQAGMEDWEANGAANGLGGFISRMEIGADITDINVEISQHYTGLATVIVDDNNANYTVVDNVIYSKDGKRLVLYPGGLTNAAVTLPDTVTEIGEYAFVKNTRITSVTMPAVTAIDAYAFSGCSKLSSLEVEGIETLKYNTFEGCTSLAVVTIKNTEGLSNYIAIDNVIYSKDGTTLALFPGGMELEVSEVTLPEAVTKISDYAFHQNTKITKVTMSAVTSVGNHAFDGCTELLEVTMPAVTTVGDHAFDGCNKLVTVAAGDVQIVSSWAFNRCTALTDFTADSLQSISENAFYGCIKFKNFTITDADSLTYVGSSAFERCSELEEFPYLPEYDYGVFAYCTSLKSVTLKPTLTEIENSVFYNCTALESITIPASVTQIGTEAFESCNALRTIVFEGSTPPAIAATAFHAIPADARFEVPTGTEEDYIAALGEYYRENVTLNGVTKYGLYVNGSQFRSDRLSIKCGDGTAIFFPDRSLLLLQNAEITEGVDYYAYGGCISSGLPDLTIQVVGDNTIHADYDGICSNRDCNVRIIGDGTLTITTTAETDLAGSSSMYVGLGSDPTNSWNGSLVIDGPTIKTNRQIQANRNITIRNSRVTIESDETNTWIRRRINSNNGGVLMIADNSEVTVDSISMGLPKDLFADSGSVYSEDMKLVMYSGKLTIADGGIYFTVKNADDDDDRGYVELKGGQIVIVRSAEEDKKLVNCPLDHITIADGFNLTAAQLAAGGVDSSADDAQAPEDTGKVDPIQPVTGVDLDKTSLDMTVGDVDTLAATVSPEEATDKTVTWSSDTPGVATVDDDGKVTAVAAGTATITATAGGKSATCTVTVTAGSGDEVQKPETPKTPDANSLEAVEKTILALKSDKDIAGSEYGKLQAKASKVTKTSVKISWKKVSGAKQYVIYGNACGNKNKNQKLATSSKTSFTLKKINGKNLKTGTYYKFTVVAVDKNGTVLSTSKMIHAATSGGKVGNVKKVTTAAKKNKVTVKVKKKVKLAGKQVAQSKKLTVKNHRKLAYESSDTKVATVTSKGVVKGVKKGTCYIYAYAQNGVSAKIKVTVK